MVLTCVMASCIARIMVLALHIAISQSGPNGQQRALTSSLSCHPLDKVRLLGASLSTTALLLYIGIVTYLPALALEQVNI